MKIIKLIFDALSQPLSAKKEKPSFKKILKKKEKKENDN